MSNVVGKKVYIPQDAILTREAVSEYLFTLLSEQTNFSMNTLGTQHSFKYNGGYGSSSCLKTYLDGVLTFDWDAEIYEVQLFNGSVGSSGSTEIDLKKSTDRGLTWTSIFSTVPQINTTATSPTYVGIGETVTGCIAPVMVTTPFNVSKGDLLRLDFLNYMQGARNLFVTIKYRPR